jgi:hypothetical protein
MDRQPSRNPAFIVASWSSGWWLPESNGSRPKIVVHNLADDGPLTRSAE